MNTIDCRAIGTNPFEFLGTNHIPNGWMVTIGYVTDSDITTGPRTQKKNISVNDARLADIINAHAGTSVSSVLENFRASDKYQSAITTGKSAPLVADGHFIKISRNCVNWKDNSHLAKFYADANEEEMRIRIAHGFGKGEDEYAENDWHRKPVYRGVASRPESCHKGMQGNPYQSDSILGDHGFYIANVWERGADNQPVAKLDANGNKIEKIATRQIRNKASKESVCFYIDENGASTQIAYTDHQFLSEAYSNAKKNSSTPVITDDMSEEEKAFVLELDKAKPQHESTFMLDSILYLKATCVDDSGSKTPFVWVNKENLKANFPYLTDETIDMFVRTCVSLD